MNPSWKKPILIAVGKRNAERVCLIVNQKSPAKTFADLRGKALDLPLGSKEYARLFLARLSAANQAKSPEAFFGSIAKSQSRNDALDQARLIDLVRKLSDDDAAPTA